MQLAQARQPRLSLSATVKIVLASTRKLEFLPEYEGVGRLARADTFSHHHRERSIERERLYLLLKERERGRVSNARWMHAVRAGWVGSGVCGECEDVQQLRRGHTYCTCTPSSTWVESSACGARFEVRVTRLSSQW
jgi:hypothetical protein